MPNCNLHSFGLLVGLLFFPALASTAMASQTPWETPPGWPETRGGAGGKIFRVTTLAAKGPGSLAEAIATTGPRTIEFSVAGTFSHVPIVPIRPCKPDSKFN